MPLKGRIAALTSVAFVLAGGAGAVMLLAYAARWLVPGVNGPGAYAGLWLLLGLPIMILVMLGGLFAGSALWLLVMRPFYSRAELRPFFSEPEIPYLTTALRRLFDVLYPRGEASARGGLRDQKTVRRPTGSRAAGEWMNAIDDLTGLIGKTPLLRLARAAPDDAIYAKCEFMNPISLKDRPVLQIIQDAEAEGRLHPGDTLIEATSGNTGMAVAFLAAIKGYKALLVMSEIQSLERRQILRAFGAELVLTPASEGTAGARARLKEILAEHPDYFYIGQHENPSNLRAHYRTTGPEIWEDTGGRIDVLVAGLGTGGTLCGAGRYLREQNPGIQLVGVEPYESPTLSQGVFRPHRMMGTAPGFVPKTLDRQLIDEILLVREADAFARCRELARTEGLLVGISSGAVTQAAMELAARPENAGRLVVGIFADTGQRYLSVEGLFE